MLSRGTFWDRKENRRRHKFICPIRDSKKFAAQHPYCPWFHPQFIKGSGCYKNIRVDVDETIRQNIDYGSESFKKDYNRRTSSEWTAPANPDTEKCTFSLILLELLIILTIIVRLPLLGNNIGVHIPLVTYFPVWSEAYDNYRKFQYIQ